MCGLIPQKQGRDPHAIHILFSETMNRLDHVVGLWVARSNVNPAGHLKDTLYLGPPVVCRYTSCRQRLNGGSVINGALYNDG